ncbi:MAG: hypothetical protein CMJ19_02560 [Phycisphaeraceae bacterium]|nr:hypothetical protein [Phycisphaeraceae bacterium]
MIDPILPRQVQCSFRRLTENSNMSNTNKRHILALNSLPASLDSDCFQVSESGEDVMALLQSGQFDMVLANCNDFTAIERNLVTDQANLVLNTIGEGVLVVNQTGQCAWSNKRMQAYPPAAMEQVLQICSRAVEIFNTLGNNDYEHHTAPSKKFSFPVGQDQFFELIASPVIQKDQPITQVVAVVWDATRSKRMEQKINAIDQAGRELAKLESDRIAKLTPTERLGLLRDKIIKTSKELLTFDHFNIRVVDERDKKLDIVIAEGLPPEALEIDLYAQPEGNGISGYVAATGRSYICHDTEKDPRYILGIKHCKSSLTVPLRLHDKIIGVFNVESDNVGAFEEDDRQFAEIFGQYIAMALNTLNLLVVERCNTSGQIADSVVQEMAKPLNDIVTEAKMLIDEYIGDDNMRTRLKKIIEDVEFVRVAVRDVAQGTKTVLGTGDISSEVHDPILTGKRILIADDEVNIRTTIGDILTKQGCHCTVCKDGFEAVTELERNKFDLVLSDIRMPHRNGYEIFASAQRKDKDMPVILMTGFGYDPHHSVVRASQEGLSAVLFKPFKVDQMLDEVCKALSSHPTPNQSSHG